MWNNFKEKIKDEARRLEKKTIRPIGEKGRDFERTYIRPVLKEGEHQYGKLFGNTPHSKPSDQTQSPSLSATTNEQNPIIEADSIQSHFFNLLAQYPISQSPVNCYIFYNGQENNEALQKFVARLSEDLKVADQLTIALSHQPNADESLEQYKSKHLTAILNVDHILYIGSKENHENFLVQSHKCLTLDNADLTNLYAALSTEIINQYESGKKLLPIIFDAAPSKCLPSELLNICPLAYSDISKFDLSKSEDIPTEDYYHNFLDILVSFGLLEQQHSIVIAKAYENASAEFIKQNHSDSEQKVNKLSC